MTSPEDGRRVSAFGAEDLEAIRHCVEDAIQAEDGLGGGLWIIIELCDAYERLRVVVEAARELLARPCSCSLHDSGCGYVQRLRAALAEKPS
jgi:hypothetical protein